MAIRAIFFDVGETIVDESRMRRVWAGWLGASEARLEGALAECIHRRAHHRTLFEALCPGFDLDRARRDSGNADSFRPGDLYPDVLLCLRELKAAGYQLGVAGNQVASVEDVFKALLPVDVVGSSDRWGCEKPSPEFFRQLVAESGFAPDEIAYVGDRVDNDVVPSRAAGMTAVLLKRGPWAAIQGSWPEAANAHLQISSLLELSGKLPPQA